MVNLTTMKTKFYYFFIALIALVLTACTGDTNDLNSENTGRLSVRLTDAPFPFELVAEANVTIFKVDARIASDEYDDSDESDKNDDDDDENDDGDGGKSFVTLMEEEIEVNLLDLTNGTTEQLADLELPAGSYDLVRVFMKGVNVVLTDGRVFDLKVPSGEQTGVKVFIKPALNIISGLSSDLLLDFDVSRSFVVRGNIKRVEGINGFIFKPVIKASNMSTAGTLAGNVSTLQEEMEVALEGAQISVMAADTLNTTAFTDADGNYTILGLEEGQYSVFAELEGFNSSDTLEVQINAANITVQDFVLEAEETAETDSQSGN